MYEKCLFFNLNSLTRRLNKVWEDEFAKLGLSAAHGYCLKLVLSRPGLPPKEMAAVLDLSASTVTRFIDSLEKEGLVKREASSEDARVIGVVPTKRAKQMESDIDKAMMSLTQEIMASLGKKNFEDLIEIVRANRKDISERKD